MRFIFATWPEVEYQAKVLTRTCARSRLVSYYFSRDMKHSSFVQYVKTGIGIYEKNGNGKRKQDERAATLSRGEEFDD